MSIKIFLFVPVLYFLALAQSSFLPHFSIFGYLPNFALVSMIIFIFLFPSFAIISAIAGGLFLDIFSSQFLGFHVLTLLIASLFFRLVLRRYVHISFR